MPWDPDVAALSVGPKGERSVIQFQDGRLRKTGTSNGLMRSYGIEEEDKRES